MAINASIIKKLYDKIDELRDVNALIELAKLNLSQIQSQDQEIRDAHDSIHKQNLVELEILEKDRADLEDSVDRTHLLLGKSIEELNQKIIDKKIEYDNFNNTIETLFAAKQRIESTLSSLKIDFESKQAEVVKLNGDIENFKIQEKSEKEELDRLKILVNERQSFLDELINEERLAQQRKVDMELYAQRIKDLYKEQGINIDI